MSLKSALRALPDDRVTFTTTETVVRYLDGHRAVSVDAFKIASVTGLDPARIQQILTVLAEGGVLDCFGEPPGYKFVRDKVLEIETQLFLRSSHSHTDSLQSNVERYRRLYGGR